MRTGLIAQKLGMSRLFRADGTHVPVSVLQVDGCQVVAQRTEEKDGYTALQLGLGKAKVKNVTKPMRGHFAKAGVEPKQKLAEFRVDADALVEVGASCRPSISSTARRSTSPASPSARVLPASMKRHNFGGLRATHGVSVSHRSHGSTGNRQDPGRTFPGKKMAGHLGDHRVTVLNLEVVRTDAERGLIMLQGGSAGQPRGPGCCCAMPSSGGRRRTCRCRLPSWRRPKAQRRARPRPMPATQRRPGSDGDAMGRGQSGERDGRHRRS